MSERDADLFEVLIRQIVENRNIDVVFGEVPDVLVETELVEPLRNLPHRSALNRLATVRDFLS
jgi:hypothetical protein